MKILSFAVSSLLVVSLKAFGIERPPAIREHIASAAVGLAFLTSPVAWAVSGGGLDFANIDISGQDFSKNNYKGKDFTQGKVRRVTRKACLYPGETLTQPYPENTR